jgi:hypothetical protein
VAILTPEDVVGRIPAECTFADERGAVAALAQTGALIVWQYGNQFWALPRKRQPHLPPLL